MASASPLRRKFFSRSESGSTPSAAASASIWPSYARQVWIEPKHRYALATGLFVYTVVASTFTCGIR